MMILVTIAGRAGQARWWLAVSSTVRLCKRDVRVVAVAVVLLVVLDLRVRCLVKAGSSSSD